MFLDINANNERYRFEYGLILCLPIFIGYTRNFGVRDSSSKATIRQRDNINLKTLYCSNPPFIKNTISLTTLVLKFHV